MIHSFNFLHSFSYSERLSLLHLSVSEADVLVFGPDTFSKEVSQYIAPLSSDIKTFAKNLGIMFHQY